MEVPIEKVSFYASDGASVVKSNRLGLAGLLRRNNKSLASVHCLAHREALGMKDAVEGSSWAQWFDEWLHELLNTFARSTKKNDLLRKLQEKLGVAKLQVLKLAVTRWLSRGNCVQRIYDIYVSLVALFKDLPTKQAVYSTLLSYKFVGTLALMLDILRLANTLNTIFQHTHVPIKTSMEAVEKFITDVEYLYLGDEIIAPTWKELQRQRGGSTGSFQWRVKAGGPPVEGISFSQSVHDELLASAKEFAQLVVNEMKQRFPTDTIIHKLAIFDWRSLPKTLEDVSSEGFGLDSVAELIEHYNDVKESAGNRLDFVTASVRRRVHLDWATLVRSLFEARQKFDEEESKRTDATEAQRRKRQEAAMDDFYAGVLKCSSYGAEIKFLICCFLCVVLSSVVCETGFSLLKQIKTKARNRLLVVTVDALMCVASLTKLLTQELAGIFMSLADLVERAYDVWDDGTRCAARSHPGVAHKRRASDSVVTMLDTYDALQWESKDCDDDDAEIIGAFSSDDEADGEDSEKGAADDADDDSAGEVSLSAETLDLLKSHGKCKSIRRGWKIVSKDEAAELIQAVDGKKKQRPWKLLHLWDKYGWREGTVLRRFPSTHSLKLPFQCRYPGAFPIGGVAAHGLNIDQYGAGGLTDDHHEIWVLIKKK